MLSKTEGGLPAKIELESEATGCVKAKRCVSNDLKILWKVNESVACHELQL